MHRETKKEKKLISLALLQYLLLYCSGLENDPTVPLTYTCIHISIFFLQFFSSASILQQV